MYEQYQTESGQAIDPVVIENVYTMTRGQPGLVSWFGKLLTETYNPGPLQSIGMETWKYVWEAARFVEPNKTVLNLIAKAKMAEYQGFLIHLFADEGLNLPALLTRYTDYLVRLKAKGINPWKAQPRRGTDYQLTEAVGHFHLYAWLRQAIGKRCVVCPEFPTGHGKVDIHVQCDTQRGVSRSRVL